MPERMMHMKHSLLNGILEAFHLESEMGKGHYYKSAGDVDVAMRDNVGLCNQDRKSDMATILYSLVRLADSKTDIDDLVYFDCFLMHLMPNSWRMGWLDPRLKKTIDPFLTLYDHDQAVVVLDALQYISRFCDDEFHNEIAEVIEYWDMMVNRREEMMDAAAFVAAIPNFKYHWNPYLKIVSDKK